MSSRESDIFLNAAQDSLDPIAERLHLQLQNIDPLHVKLLSSDFFIDFYGPSGHGLSVNATLTPIDAKGKPCKTLAIAWVVKFFDATVKVPHRVQNLSELPELVDSVAKYIEIAINQFRLSGAGNWQAIIEFVHPNDFNG
jgi:hypothetical protein